MKRGIKLYRVFFNKLEGTREKAWSVDTGEGTKRRHFANVTITTPVTSVSTGKKSDGKNPVAWFEMVGRLGVQVIHMRNGSSLRAAMITSGEGRR
jgi:hypothetical protein